MKKQYRCHSSPGFSFIELIVVMVIIGIMAAIAIPAFMVWKPNYELRRAARDIFSIMQTTKMDAIKSNQNRMITFNPGGLFYQYAAPSGTTQTINLIEYNQDITFGSSAGVPAGQPPLIPIGDGVTYTNDQVAFQPRGTVSEIGYIYIRNAKGTSYAVGTSSSVGAVVLQKWSGAAWE